MHWQAEHDSCLEAPREAQVLNPWQLRITLAGPDSAIPGTGTGATSSTGGQDCTDTDSCSETMRLVWILATIAGPISPTGFFKLQPGPALCLRLINGTGKLVRHSTSVSRLASRPQAAGCSSEPPFRAFTLVSSKVSKRVSTAGQIITLSRRHFS